MSESLTKGNFSFTFTISETKVIYYKGKRLPYGSFHPDKQFDFLETHLQKINKFDNIKWVYEFHSPGVHFPPRLHVHGYVWNTSLEEMNDFRADFYSNPIQIAYSGQIKLSLIERTYKDENFWINYCNKHQNEIAYYMRVDQDKKHSAALDGKKWKFTIDSNIDAHYLNSLEEHLESRVLGEKYQFGKLNKFLVEI